MTVRSYFAPTIAEAILKARRELGPDAMIVASRKTGPDDDVPNAYEVVCGFTEADRPSVPAPAAPQRAAVQKPPEVVQVVTKPSPVTQIKRGLKAVKAVLMQPAPAVPTDEISHCLRTAGFGDMVDEVVQSVQERLGDGRDVRRALWEELSYRLQVAPVLGRPRARRQIVAVIGPPGAGKTTTVAKIALKHGLMMRRRVHLITMDSQRLGGPELLRTYASAMDTPFSALKDADALETALERETGQALVVIDTPGLCSGSMTRASHLAGLLSAHPDVDVHLALPAWGNPADLASTVGRFRHFLPSKFLLTGVDMAQSCLPAVAQAMLHQRPISFLSTGQEVPDDLENATADRLLGFAGSIRALGAVSAA